MKKLLLLTVLMFGAAVTSYSQDVTLTQEEAKRVFAQLGELKATRVLNESLETHIQTLNALKAAQSAVIVQQETTIKAQDKTIEILREMKCSKKSYFWGLVKTKRCI